MDDEDRALRLQRRREYGDKVSCSREKMLKSCMAAATPERMWQGRHIIGWLDWVGVDERRHAVFVLDDGAQLQIHEKEGKMD